MLDMGFVRDIEKILKRMPQKKQTMLFSATVTKEIEKLSKKYLTNPVHVSMESAIKPEFLRQVYYQTSTANKLPALISLLKKERDLALVFCNMKHSTSKLAKKLIENGVHAKCLHGDLTQNQRERVTEDFRNRKFNVLIATDVASRGLHIEGITHVYNYEIPRDVESYTHRVGRTARAGKKGEAISLVSGGEDAKFFKNILFNYTGTITLKTFDGKDAELSAVKHEEEVPKNRKKPPFRSKDRKDNKDHDSRTRGWRNR
jgi:ATP-dependent RNA helicase DeaD